MTVTDLGFADHDLSGLSLIRRMRSLEPNVRILALSMHDDPVVAAQAPESGALGYVPKDASTAHITGAFQNVRNGRSYLEHRLATRVAMLKIRSQGSRLGQRSGSGMGTKKSQA